MRKILFIAAHRQDRSPSQRFRFEQYFKFLSENGFQCHLSPIISTEGDIFHHPGRYLSKMGIVAKAAIKRLRDSIRAHKYDLVFIQREAFMLGTTIFEKLLKKSGARVVFDFDDAIWLQDISEINKNVAFLKKPSKTSTIISLSDWVIAGNQHLAEYARSFNQHVTIIPTTIDTEEYKPPIIQPKRKKVTIGWSGSFSTIKHFTLALPALMEVRKKFGDQVSFQLIGDSNYSNIALDLVGKAWKKETELEDLLQFDIGIMPLPDDEWSKGKCGLKGLQYMALEIPCIMSPVGVNPTIIRDNQNGFLASTTDQWVEKISLLIANEELRKRLGREGRKTVVEKYSVESQKNNYLSVFNNLLSH